LEGGRGGNTVKTLKFEKGGGVHDPAPQLLYLRRTWADPRELPKGAPQSIKKATLIFTH